MIQGLEIDLHSATPVYQQIVDAIVQAAVDGRLRPDHKLPPTRELARTLGVNRNTVIAAYDRLAAEGWIRSHTGRGTFLVPRPNAAPNAAGEPEPGDGPAGEPWFTEFSREVDGASVSGLQSIYSLAIATEGISFVGSYPADELMPVVPFGRSMAAVLEEDGARALVYGPTAGHPSLRETIAAGMRRSGSPADADHILVTNGAQQAIELVFRAFVDRGEAVVVEEPTYTGALSVLGSLGARVVGVPVDEEGIRPDLLAAALARHRPRLIYVQPTFQNPTTRETSESRRRELLALAGRYHCPIVEDDWGGDLRLEGRSLPTLHAMDGGRHVIYLSTFSKKLMPGLRVGWVAAPQPVLDRLVELKRVQDCGTSPLLQAALDRFLRDGGLEDHLERILPAYRERRDCMAAALDRDFPREAHWDRPTGGLFFWVTLPEDFDGNDLFVAARRNGVPYSRGELFHSDGSGRNTFRLTYSGASPEQIREGVATLGRLIRERWPEPRRFAQARSTQDVPIF